MNAPVMNAPYVIHIDDAEGWNLTIAKWARQSEERGLRRLYGTFDAPEAEEDEGGLPPIAALDDEYSAAADLGREE